MTRLPPQPDDSLDQAAASISESRSPRAAPSALRMNPVDLPAFQHRCAYAGRAPRRIAWWRGSPRHRAVVPLDPEMAICGNRHIRPLHVIADMKGDDSTDRSPFIPGMKRPSQRKQSR